MGRGREKSIKSFLTLHNMKTRNRKYLTAMADDRKMLNQMKKAFGVDMERGERTLPEKLRIKKGGKLKDQQLNLEAWRQEMRDICPND
jgi:hypothetical protein